MCRWCLLRSSLASEGRAPFSGDVAVIQKVAVSDRPSSLHRRKQLLTKCLIRSLFKNIPIFFLPFKRRIAQLPIFSDRHHEDIAAIAAVVRVTRPMVKLRFSKTQNKGQPLHVYDGLEEASLALKYRGFESALPDFSASLKYLP